MQFQNKLATIVCVLLLSEASAQQVSDPSGNIPVNPASVPAAGAYPGLYNTNAALPKNYVRTWIPDQPVNQQDANAKHRQVTEYFDGLGRPLQVVEKKAHAEGHDIVQHYFYDVAGRQSLNYLPYIKLLQNSNGNFDASPQTRIGTFYPHAQGQPPHSKTEYDNSPLSRVTKTLAPGKSWVGSDRGRVISYKTNRDETFQHTEIPPTPLLTYVTIKSAFPIYEYTGNTIVYKGNYGTDQLYITTEVDEDGKTTEVVKDKLERLIATRVLAHKVWNSNYPQSVAAGIVPENWEYTFYVYDNLSRLRAVMPPGVVFSNYIINNSTGVEREYVYTWSVPTTAQIEGLCYVYRYDNRARMIEKKVPGKTIEYFVYDERDRPVLHQDGKLRQDSKWHFSFYDGLNRPTVSGLVTLTGSRADLQSQAHPATPPTAPAQSWLYYVVNYKTLTPSQLYPATINSAEILSYTYYDNYNLLPNIYDVTKIPAAPAGDATVVASTQSRSVQGMVTGTKVKVLDSGSPVQWITTVLYYDGKGRLIQSASNNLKGGTDYQSTLYHFQGMPFRTVTEHQNPAAQPVPGAATALNDIKLDNTYRRNLGDGGNDRVWQVQQTINDGTPYNLAYYDYDHMGRVVVKQYSIAHVLQEYNIRGWLNHIHARSSADHTITYFKETLHYDDGFATKLYNGNIAGITWNNFNDDDNVKKHAYGYTYDRLGRLHHAEYRNNFTGASNWQKQNKDYTASNITYDGRGNILTMNQRGNTTAGPIDMDILSYNYAPNSNRLLKVTDGVAPGVTQTLPDFKDNANLATEYTYDANGNLISDANKSITSITYNHLNKPVVITVQGKGTLTHVYDAAGNTLQKKVYDQVAGTTEIWDYMGNFVYKNNVLQYILNEEGRSRPELVTGGIHQGATKFVYDYFIKDHLGNVRSTIAAEPSSFEYFAAHEIVTANSEQLMFENIAAVRDDKPGSLDPNDTQAARLDGSDPDRTIGTAIMLRVMPGDKFNLAADVYYEDDGESEPYDYLGTEDVVTSLLGTLAGGTVGGVPVSETGGNDIINSIFENPENLTLLHDMITDAYPPDGSMAPRAGLNYLFFNEEMQLLPMSGILSAGGVSAGAFHNIAVGPPMVMEPGYLLVYVDNQSLGKEAWFDNIQVLHYTAEVREENHYYPFGLTVSSAAAGHTVQPYKYTGKELERSFGLEQYDFIARIYDPQIGRWQGVDPLADADKNIRYSPYVYAINNPITYIDPDGRCWQKVGDSYVPCNDASIGSTTNDAFGYNWTMTKSNGWQLTNGTNPSTVNYQYDHIEPTGDASYYVDRYKNHIEKYNTRPPDYYLGYGHKYINRFKNETRGKLTAFGKEWLDETAVALQKMMNDGIRLNKDIQGDNGAFHDFAYKTHVPAYSGSGKIGLLKGNDLWHIMWTPDIKDSFLSSEGRSQIMGMFPHILKSPRNPDLWDPQKNPGIKRIGEF